MCSHTVTESQFHAQGAETNCTVWHPFLHQMVLSNRITPQYSNCAFQMICWIDATVYTPKVETIINICYMMHP